MSKKELEIEYAKGQTPSMFKYQPPAVLNQAAPVQNTWYTLLDTTAYVRVYEVGVNIEDTNETVEIRAIVDGETIGITATSLTHSTTYWAYRLLDAINRLDRWGLTNANASDKISFIIAGHSVKIEIRKTTATGTGNFTGIVIYGVLSDAR